MSFLTLEFVLRRVRCQVLVLSFLTCSSLLGYLRAATQVQDRRSVPCFDMTPRRRNAGPGATSLRIQGVLALVLVSVLVALLGLKVTPSTEGPGMEHRLVSVNMRRNDGSTLSPFVGLMVSSESVPVAVGDRLKSGTVDIDAQASGA